MFYERTKGNAWEANSLAAIIDNILDETETEITNSLLEVEGPPSEAWSMARRIMIEANPQWEGKSLNDRTAEAYDLLAPASDLLDSLLDRLIRYSIAGAKARIKACLLALDVPRGAGEESEAESEAAA